MVLVFSPFPTSKLLFLVDLSTKVLRFLMEAHRRVFRVEVVREEGTFVGLLQVPVSTLAYRNPSLYT